jgi:mycothione reductase
VPEIDGLADVAFHTTDNVMRIDTLPASMVILGGSYVAAEMGHLFGAFGTKITIIDREPRLLATLDDDLAQRFTDINAERFDVRLGAKVTRIDKTARGVAVHLEGGTQPGIVEAESLFVATGRVPNTDVLDVKAGGIAVDDKDKITTDDAFATNVPGVWAIGDVVNHFELKHLANAQMRIAMHNVLHPDEPRRANFPAIPAAVFADPQIATVGPTERALQHDGARYVVARRDYAETAFGWALEDTTSFVKLIADPQTRRLLAAHILGPQAATLVQPLVQAIYLGNTIDQLAYDVLYIHPAITEVLAQALLELAKHTP